MPESPANNPELVELLMSCRSALFVGAHPDDIEFRAGGLVQILRQMGVEVTFAVATRGGKGWIWPFGKMLEWLRVRHQREAARILGGAEVVFFDYPDGCLPDYVGAFTVELQSLLDSLQPGVVLCWDPDHNLNPHPDHQAAAEAVRDVVVDRLACWYGSSEPNLRVGFGEETLQVKIAAIKAHRTETPWFYFDARVKKRFIEAMRAEGSKIGSDYAETFRLIPPRR